MVHKWGEFGVVETAYQDGKAVKYLTASYTYYGAGRERGWLSDITLTDIATGAKRQTGYAYSFHGNGVLASETVTQALPSGPAVTTHNYDSAGNLASTVNALNQTEKWLDYDGLGQPGTHVDQNGIETRFTYNANGTLATIMETGSRITRLEYNHRGQPTAITLPSGQVTRYRYNAAGRLESVGNALAEYAHRGVDIAGNKVFQESPRRIPTLSGGGPIGADDGVFSAGATLDSLGRPYTISGKDGQRADYRYDGNGNVTSITNSMNQQIVKHTMPKTGLAR